MLFAVNIARGDFFLLSSVSLCLRLPQTGWAAAAANGGRNRRSSGFVREGPPHPPTRDRL